MVSVVLGVAVGLVVLGAVDMEAAVVVLDMEAANTVVVVVVAIIVAVVAVVAVGMVLEWHMSNRMEIVE